MKNNYEKVWSIPNLFSIFAVLTDSGSPLRGASDNAQIHYEPGFFYAQRLQRKFPYTKIAR